MNKRTSLTMIGSINTSNRRHLCLFALIVAISGVAMVSACAENESCDACLAQNCVWIPVEGCLESCAMIADTSCYDPTNFPDLDVPAICSLVADAEADAALCNSQEDCSSCVGTILSDGTTTCQWFSDGELCDSGCGMDGCGETTCMPTMDDCEGNEACSDCLEEGCAWTNVQGCIVSCDIIADAACFDSNTNGTIADICTVANDSAADTQLCVEQDSCEACVGTILSDDTITCQWYGDYCQSGCGMDGCGAIMCPGNETSANGDADPSPPQGDDPAPSPGDVTSTPTPTAGASKMTLSVYFLLARCWVGIFL